MAMTQLDESTYTMFVQVFMAFGQGAGPLLASGETILALTEDYRGAAERDRNSWNAIAPVVLGWARAVGALSGHHALHDSRFVISREDYQYAKDVAARHSEILLSRCPWTPRESE
jgi:hypothetical protein